MTVDGPSDLRCDPCGITGNGSRQITQIATVRNTVASMRANGANPQLLLVNHDVGAELDLEVQPASAGDYVLL